MNNVLNSIKRLAGIAVIVLGVCVPSYLDAQQSQPTQGNVEAGLGFLLGFPQGEFKQNVDKIGAGLGLNIAYLFRPVPLSIGAEGGFMIYGHVTRKAPWSETIPDVTLDVETSNYIAQLHMFLRLQPSEGPVRPYMDGLIGLNYFWTETSVKSESRLTSGEEIASSTNQSDMAFSYGGGGGLKVRVYETVTKDNKLVSLLVDLRVRYLIGGKAEYVREVSVGNDNKPRYDIRESTTDLLTAQLGVSVVF